MGKRSRFERNPRDFYRTWDPRAVEALLPHLKPRTRFASPCAGQLDLVRQLEAAGHHLYWSSDIHGQEVTYTVSGVPVTRTVLAADALTLTIPLQMADCIIENTPWRRDILHPMIEHFIANSKYCWLLIDAGWAFTEQAAPYMYRCSDFVAMSRLKWIPDTKHDHTQDAAWYRFSKDAEYTVFHPREITPKASKVS